MSLGHPGGWAALRSTEETLDGQVDRVDVPSLSDLLTMASRKQSNKQTNKILEEQLC